MSYRLISKVCAALALMAVPFAVTHAQSTAAVNVTLPICPPPLSTPDFVNTFPRASGQPAPPLHTVVSAFVRTGAISLSPADPIWGRAPTTALSLPMFYDKESEANPAFNTLSGPRAVNVQSVNNGTDIAFRFQWQDSTKDMVINDAPKFGDGMALELPFNNCITGLYDDKNRAFGLKMGEPGYPVEIIFWRGDLSKPQNVTAAGEGGTQTSPDSDTLPIRHSQTWSGGLWTVIVKRPLSGAGSTRGNMVPLRRGTTYPIGWANYNGGPCAADQLVHCQERNGRKFVTLDWDALVIQ